jgi:hypothetical protein
MAARGSPDGLSTFPAVATVETSCSWEPPRRLPSIHLQPIEEIALAHPFGVVVGQLRGDQVRRDHEISDTVTQRISFVGDRVGVRSSHRLPLACVDSCSTGTGVVISCRLFFSPLCRANGLHRLFSWQTLCSQERPSPRLDRWKNFVGMTADRDCGVSLDSDGSPPDFCRFASSTVAARI